MKLSSIALALSGAGIITIPQLVKGLFSRLGSNAHMYLPGAQTPVLGPELVTNGDFSNGATGWSIGTGFSVSDGKLVINGGNAGSVFTTSVAQLATVVGRTYRVQFGYTLTSGRFRLNPVSGVTTTLVTAGSGTYTQDFVATAAGDLFIQAPDAATVGSIDNISVREILSYNDVISGFHTGNYVESTGVTPATVDQPVGLVKDAANVTGGIDASQSTSGFRPTMRKGIVNLLTWSNDLMNGAWSKIGTATAPSANTLNTPANNDYAFESVTAATYAGKQITVFFKLSGSGTVAIGSYDNVSSFQLDTINLTATPTIYAKTLTVGTGAVDVRIALGRISTTATSVTCDGAGMALGSYAASQILAYGGIPLTTTAAASSAMGPYYLQFDGTDDALVSSTFAAGTFGADCDIIMSVRRNSAANTLLLYDANSVGARFVGVVQSGSGASTMATGAAFTVFVDGVQIGSLANVTRDQMNTALTVGVSHVVEFRNVDLSAWTSFAFGAYSSFMHNGLLHSLQITPAMNNADRTVSRKFAAQLAGVTL